MDEPSAFEQWEQDKRFEDGMRRLRDMAAFHEAAQLEAAEASLAETETLLPNGCPAPLSWHPWYRGKAWLIDWLNDDPRCGLPWDTILIPVLRPLRLLMSTDLDLYPTEPLNPALRITKRRAAGPAPYVGRPFVYAWNVSEDDYGRRCAGESRIVYTDRWVPGGFL